MSFEDAEDFERWWGKNGNIFESEALAIECLLEEKPEDAIVIGNGTGRFAVRLGLSFGIDPSPEMCRLAREKGMDAMAGKAEDLPFEDEQFSLVLLIGVLAYVQDLEKTIMEAYRILKPEGNIIIAFLPRGRSFTKIYERAAREGSFPDEAPETPYPIKFLKEANWRSVGEVLDLLHDCGFVNLQKRQTLTEEPKKANYKVEVPKMGHDSGSWVVFRGKKKKIK